MRVLGKVSRTSYQKKYSRTMTGLIKRIHAGQVSRSRRRGMDLPNYSSNELVDFVFSTHEFSRIYSNWQDSGYAKDLKPSLDRIDDYKPYTFDNIQVVTWVENNLRGKLDQVNGINTKNCKAIIGTSKSGNKVEYFSIKDASRITGIHDGNISECAKGERKTAGKIAWEYKQEEVS